VFELESLEVTAGADVAFAFALAPDRRPPREQPGDPAEFDEIEPIPEPVS